MAKKKRFNKKMIILLASIGAVMVTGAVVVVIRRLPKNPKVYAGRAVAAIKEGNYPSAAGNYAAAARAAKDTDPQKPEYLLAQAKALLEWNRKDRALTDSARSRNYRDARLALQNAMLFNPKFVEAQRHLTELEYGMSWSQRRPDYKRCVTTINKLLALAPDDHEVLYKRAMAYAQLAKNDAAYLKPALEDFQVLVKLAPSQEHYWLGLVGIHLMGQDAERFEQAEKIYKEALSANKDSAGLRINYAQFLIRREGRKPDAVKLLRDTAKDSFGAAGYLALAAYYRQERDLDQAVDNLKKAAKIEPANYRGYAELARVYSIQKKPDEAQAILRKGLDTVRKSKKPELKGAELHNYRVGIVILNHQLCDAMLDRPATGAEREEAVRATRDALKEMQKEMQDVGKGSRLFARVYPYVVKIEGRLALVDGKLIEAEKLLRRAYDSFRTGDGRLYLEPKTAELLINLYRQLGQPGESQKIVARFVRLSGGSPSALLAMVRLYVESRQYEQAQRLVRSILEHHRSESLLSIQAGLDVVMGRSNRIPAGLKELDPLAVRMFLRRGQQLWLEGEAETAIQLVSDLSARRPKHLGAMIQLIQWHRLRGESAQADAVLARAREAYKDDQAVLDRLKLMMVTDQKKLLAQLLAQASKEPDPLRRSLRLANIYLSFGQKKKFLEHLSAAEAADPKNRTVIRQRFEYAIAEKDWASAEKYAKVAGEIDIDAVGGRMYAARLAATREQIDDAIRLAQEALRIRPRFSQAHSFLGDCYLVKGQIDQARKEYESAHSQNPSNIAALVGLIRVSAAAGNVADYTRWVELAYKFAPQNPLVREQYLRLRSDPEKIIKHREKVRESQPKNLVNLSYLAMLYERTGRHTQAEETYKAMVQISGGDPRTVRALADFLRRRNRDVEARGMLADYAAKATDKITAYLIWADYLDTAGDADQAKTIYQKALAADPNDSRGYLGAARFAARHGKWGEAADNQQKYMNITGEKTPPLARKDMIAYLINANRLDDAEKRIDRVLEKNRSDVEMLTLKALTYIKRKNYARAKELLDHTLKIRLDYVPALVRRADVHLVNRDIARAIADLESARRAGAIPTVVVRLANLYESNNDVNSALAVLQGLLAEYPRDPVVLKSLAGLYGRHKRWPNLEKILADGKKAWPKDTFYHRKEADMWLTRKVPAKAVAALDAATKLAPDNIDIAFFRMRALVEAGRFNDAIAVGKKLRSNKDIAPSVMSVTALALAKSNRHSAAENEFSAAIKAAKSGGQLFFVLRQVRSAYSPAQTVEKLKLWAKARPNDAQIYQALGEILMGQKDPKGAAEYLNKALTYAKTERHKAFIMGRLGLIYFELGQHDASLRMYHGALKIVPNDAGILNNLAWLLAHDMKKPDQAMPYAKKACELVPNNAEALDTYGYVLMLKGKYDEALNVLSRSVDRRAMPANRLHLGEVHEKMKRPDDARREYQLGWELVKDDPGNKYYRELSEAIKRVGGTPGGST